VRHQSKILRFLHRRCTKRGKTGSTRCHHIAIITKDRWIGKTSDVSRSDCWEPPVVEVPAIGNEDSTEVMVLPS
jgi:hypothetical protein